MYNGSMNETLSFYSGICFTDSCDSAAAYGDYVSEVEIDTEQLNILHVEMTDEEMRNAIDDQEWPCDRQSDRDAAVAQGYDAVSYSDCDERGATHDCLRILSIEAFSRSVKIK